MELKMMSTFISPSSWLSAESMHWQVYEQKQERASNMAEVEPRDWFLTWSLACWWIQLRIVIKICLGKKMYRFLSRDCKQHDTWQHVLPIYMIFAWVPVTRRCSSPYLHDLCLSPYFPLLLESLFSAVSSVPISIIFAQVPISMAVWSSPPF